MPRRMGLLPIRPVCSSPRMSSRFQDAEATAFAASHRLSQKPNAGITLRFVDLAQRDSGISGTKYFKNYSGKVSISLDLPRYLPSERWNNGSACHTPNGHQIWLKLLPQWPFVELQIEGQSPKMPSSLLSSVTSKMLSIEPLLRLREFDWLKSSQSCS